MYAGLQSLPHLRLAILPLCSCITSPWSSVCFSMAKDLTFSHLVNNAL